MPPVKIHPRFRFLSGECRRQTIRDLFALRVKTQLGALLVGRASFVHTDKRRGSGLFRRRLLPSLNGPDILTAGRVSAFGNRRREITASAYRGRILLRSGFASDN